MASFLADGEVPIGTRATVDGVPWILSADGWGPVPDPETFAEGLTPEQLAPGQEPYIDPPAVALVHAVRWEANDNPDPRYPLFADGRWVCTCGAHWPGKPFLALPEIEGVLPAWADPAAMWGPGILHHLKGVPQ